MAIELNRRDFIKILGGATVATVLPGCTRKKPQTLIPYVIPHEEIVPGKSVWYASVCRECPAGCGIHVRVREGRAVKIEGNPVNPINHGALCARGQAALQSTYNPDRIQHPMRKKSDGTFETITWEQATNYLIARLILLQKEKKSSGIAFITQHITGSLDTLVDDFLNTLGSTRRLRYEPIAYESLKRASELSFGVNKIPTYNFAPAKYIISFGADFLESWLSPVGYAHDFSKTREFDGRDRNRFVYVGPRFSMTAANADEWIALTNGTEGVFALGMVNVILSEKLSTDISPSEITQISRIVRDFTPIKVSVLTGMNAEKIQSLAREFASAKPGLAISGGTVLDNESAVETLCAVNLLNHVCGNVGETITYSPSTTLSKLNTYSDLTRFVKSINDGEVNILFLNDANPVFSTPPAVGFTDALKKIPLIVVFSSFMDETTTHAGLVLPIHTQLESWGDYEPTDNVHGLMQPAMQAVFKSTKMFGDILLEIVGKLKNDSYYYEKEQPFLEYVKDRWRSLHKSSHIENDFDAWWVGCLANGGEFTEKKSIQVVKPQFSSDIFQSLLNPKTHSAGKFSLVTYPHIAHYDGRGANRPWLQELPDPMTMMTWENWVEIHPNDAIKLNIKRGDILKISSENGTIELPAYDYEGIREGTIAIAIGQGHSEYGRYANGSGENVIRLLSANPNKISGGLNWSDMNVSLAKSGRNEPLADVAGSDYLHGRNIIETVTVNELLGNTGDNKKGEEKHEQSMYEAQDHPNHRWGMTIDLDKCTGCSACVTSCYAENNVPVVGKKQVEIGRELSWIRIERFFDDPPTDPLKSYQSRAEFIPMMCQQCDNAPCEPVCPVYAAYHTEEGLNAQVYNRCVGTRYCSNNCPYKVRRFNWFDYTFPEPLNWQLNPDVTVRTKGIMEKCTFCIQRIVEGKMNAKKEGRQFQDGDIVTACQQVCPTQAIVFGDLKDPQSKVSRLREEHKHRKYRVLEELDTGPSIVYLKGIRL